MLASSYVRQMPWFVVIWACPLGDGTGGNCPRQRAGRRGTALDAAVGVDSALGLAALRRHAAALSAAAACVYPLFGGCLVLLVVVFLTQPRNGASVGFRSDRSPFNRRN